MEKPKTKLMEYRHLHAPVTTRTNDTVELSQPTGNIYQTAMVIAKRADQITQELTQELKQRLEEYSVAQDSSLEEISENVEQIELSREYEELPKTPLLAYQEYTQGVLRYKMVETAQPASDKDHEAGIRPER